MLIWIICTLLDSISSIFWKKSLEYKLHPYVMTLYGHSTGFLILPFFFYLLDIKLENLFFAIVIWCIFSVFEIIWEKFETEIYKVEKFSTMAPFENLSTIFTIIIWFLLFKDSSLNAFLITLFILALIILFSFDFKNFKFPKVFWKILLSHFSYSISTLIVAYWVLKLWWEAIFMADLIWWFIIFSIFVLIVWKQKDFLNMPKGFLKNRTLSWLIWWSSYMLSLMIISDFWVIISSMLSFLWLSSTLLLSYIFLWDEPEKKDLIMSTIVTILVAVWFYFK